MTASLSGPARPVHLAEVQLPKEGGRPVVSNLLLRSSRAAAGQRSPLFPEWTTTVYCSFDVRGLRNGTKVSVHWRRGGRELTRNDFVIAQGTRNLSTQLASDGPLSPGTYEVEVRVSDRPEATTTFRIAGEEQAEPQTQTSTEPRVSGLALSTEECDGEPSSRPRAVTTFRRGVHTVFLCLQYENIRRGQRLEVSWYLGRSSTDPLAATTYNPTGDGELSALYTEDSGIPEGSYHVVVTLDGHEAARVRFVVRP